MFSAFPLRHVHRPGAIVCLWVCSVVILTSAEIVAVNQTRVSYRADDQNVSVLLPALSTLAGERYEPAIDLLVDGVTATHATLALQQASRASCRQALAFSLGCWWSSSVDVLEQKIILSHQETMPQGELSVRTIGSTLLHHHSAQAIAESMLKPWLYGQAGVSYLPAEGFWSATLDEAGHRRLIEILSLLERSQPTASTWVPSPDVIDRRRVLSTEINATSWGSLVLGLSQAGNISVALSPRLRLRVFSSKNIFIERVPLGELSALLNAYDIKVFWRDGVLCLGEAGYSADDADREHPAQRRRLALVPIGHLITGPLDGELIAASLQKRVATRWWQHQCAGMRYLPSAQALLIAADIPTQHAIYQALGSLDRLGLAFGLSSLGMESQP